MIGVGIDLWEQPLFGAGTPAASIVLSNATIADTASVGDLVGNLSVVNGSGTYTYTLTSNPGTLFSITTAALKTAAALTAGSDAITVHADNGAGSVLNRAFLITVTSSASTAGQPMGLLLTLTYAA